MTPTWLIAAGAPVAMLAVLFGLIVALRGPVGEHLLQAARCGMALAEDLVTPARLAAVCLGLYSLAPRWA